MFEYLGRFGDGRVFQHLSRQRNGRYGVFNSCVMLLIKSFFISDKRFCLNKVTMVYINVISRRNVNNNEGIKTSFLPIHNPFGRKIHLQRIQFCRWVAWKKSLCVNSFFVFGIESGRSIYYPVVIIDHLKTVRDIHTV